ncbi:MAG: DUF4383 domain-containing protein [Pseudomonadales bacterium]|nr:DUF4383 domain-containing protein [Pseudomonadales bacterium]
MQYSRKLAIVFGATFILVGLLGFIPNPIVHAEGIFVTNAMHNLVHLITGAAFFLVMMFPGRESAVVMSIGAGYLSVALLGFIVTGDYLLGVIHINQADRWLHAALALGILLTGRLAARMDSTAVAG